MRIELNNTRIAVACAAGIIATTWMLHIVVARFHPAIQGPMFKREERLPRVEYHTPISPEEASTWRALSRKISLKPGREIIFSEFLSKIRVAAIDKNLPDGLMIYVEPIGLIHPELGPESTVALDLENVKVATALEWGLKQLDQRFYVTSDGIVMITSSRSGDLELPHGPILDRLDALRAEMRELRATIDTKK